VDRRPQTRYRLTRVGHFSTKFIDLASKAPHCKSVANPRLVGRYETTLIRYPNAAHLFVEFKVIFDEDAIVFSFTLRKTATKYRWRLSKPRSRFPTFRSRRETGSSI
jgi:hypothetical protein